MKSLRILHAVLTFVMVVFAIGTIVAIATTPATLGSGGVGVHATVDRKLSANAVHAVAAKLPYRVERGDVRLTIYVPARDHATRRVMAGGLLAGVALFWVGLLALRGVVGAARDGRPFEAANVARLRLLGAAIIAAPIVVGVVNRMLEASFDSEVLHVEVARVDIGPMVLIGLGVLALAEVFRTGSELRELEASTV